MASSDSTLSSMAPHPSKELIEHSYDIIAPTYLDWILRTPSPREHYIEQLISVLPTSSRPSILELGCGAGKPTTEYLCEHADVTANDISSAQLALAKQIAPAATLIHSDMMSLSFAEQSFDAVVAFFSIIHLPREEQAELIKRLFKWVKEGGYFLGNLGVVEIDEKRKEDFLGEPMYWSGWDERGNREMVQAAGWEIVEAKVIDQLEKGYGGGEDRMVPFMWILGRKKTV